VVGRIVNTTSGAGLTGNFGQSSYATAKAAIVGLTLTLAQELRSYGVTVNAVGPSGATRITGTMPGAPPVIEPDEVPADEWQPMDPANSSPLVAWLASDESQLITGQVLRSIYDRVIWMHGWREGAQVSAGERRWDAAELGLVLATDVFRVASPGLRFL
jgi:NAD(P)-dependent dehydrogenase (short-subunit alcohol dehydrogenase family)